MPDGAPRVVLIAGAGYVGGHLAEALVRDGARVISVRRREENLVRPAASGAAEAGVWHGIKGDLRDPHLGDLVRGVEPAVHQLVITVSPPRSASSRENSAVEFRSIMEGAVQLAGTLRVNRLLYTSSTGVYEERDGGWVDETSPLAGKSSLAGRFPTPGSPRDDERSRRLLDAEEIVLKASGISSCVLRLTGIYGPGRNPLRRYLAPEKLPMRGEFWTNRVRVEDAVSALRLLMDGTASAGAITGAVNCSDDVPTRAIEVARWVMERRGVEWPERIPFVRDEIAGSGELMRPPRSNKRVSNALLKSLGWKPKYRSYQEGMREFLQET